MLNCFKKSKVEMSRSHLQQKIDLEFSKQFFQLLNLKGNISHQPFDDDLETVFFGVRAYQNNRFHYDLRNYQYKPFMGWNHPLWIKAKLEAESSLGYVLPECFVYKKIDENPASSNFLFDPQLALKKISSSEPFTFLLGNQKQVNLPIQKTQMSENLFELAYFSKLYDLCKETIFFKHKSLAIKKVLLNFFPDVKLQSDTVIQVKNISMKLAQNNGLIMCNPDTLYFPISISIDDLQLCCKLIQKSIV